jgi:hypothetical protein
LKKNRNKEQNQNLLRPQHKEQIGGVEMSVVVEIGIGRGWTVV